MRVPHTACHRGKRVKIILKDGTQIIDYFQERTDKFVILRRLGRLGKDQIRAFMILKG